MRSHGCQRSVLLRPCAAATRVGLHIHKAAYVFWFCGLVARAFDLQLNGRDFETRRPLALSGSDLGQVTHTYVPLSVTKQYNLVPV